MCSGAFKTSLIPASLVVMGEMPLEIQRKQLSANYWTSLQGKGDSDPTTGVLGECKVSEGQLWSSRR